MKKDCDNFKECLKKYQIKGEDVIDLRNPSSKKVEEVMKQLSKRMREGKNKTPTERYFIIFLFAGHGILEEGTQILLYNEYNKKTGFYEKFRAEAKLRAWAYSYPNVYLVGIFACCR